MLDTLITNKTRIKLLLRLFLNSQARSYLRNLESEFGESSNAIRLELNRFEEAGLLKSSLEGNKKLFFANVKHPLFPDIQSILRKYTGIDQIIEKVLHRLGGLKKAYLVGDLAKGMDTRIIDLLLICNGIDQEYLVSLIDRAEKLIDRKVRYFVLKKEEEKVFLKYYPEALLLWEENC